MNIRQINTLILKSRKVLVNGVRLVTHSVGITSVNEGNSTESFIKLDMTGGAPSGWIFLEESATRKASLNGQTLDLQDDEGRSINMIFYPYRLQPLKEVTA